MLYELEYLVCLSWFAQIYIFGANSVSIEILQMAGNVFMSQYAMLNYEWSLVKYFLIIFLSLHISWLMNH